MTSRAKEQLRVHIRWMIRGDMDDALEIENQSFEFPWSEDDFVRCLGNATASAWSPSTTTRSSAS